MVHPAELVPPRSDMAHTEESVKVPQRQLGNVQSALLVVDCDCDKYHSYLSFEAQQCSDLEAYFGSLRRLFVYHLSYVDSTPDFLR